MRLTKIKNTKEIPSPYPIISMPTFLLNNNMENRSETNRIKLISNFLENKYFI